MNDGHHYKSLNNLQFVPDLLHKFEVKFVGLDLET